MAASVSLWCLHTDLENVFSFSSSWWVDLLQATHVYKWKWEERIGVLSPPEATCKSHRKYVVLASWCGRRQSLLALAGAHCSVSQSPLFTHAQPHERGKTVEPAAYLLAGEDVPSSSSRCRHVLVSPFPLVWSRPGQALRWRAGRSRAQG